MLLAFAGIFIFASCKKDETPTLTKEEATKALETLNTGFASLNNEFNSTDAILVQEELGQIGLPFDMETPLKSPSTSKKFKADYLKIIKPELSKNYEEGGPFIDFNFIDNVGTYTYSDGWSKTSSEPANAIVLIFPFRGGTATLTYNEYQTKEFNSTPYISHLKFKAEISGQQTPIYTWEYTANRSATSASISLIHTLGNFSQTESVSFSASTSSLTISFDFIFKKDNTTIFAEEATAITSKSSVIMNIKVTILNIVVEYNIDMDQNSNEEGNPGDYTTISVWTTDGYKVADVIFKSEGNEYIPYFVYSDGSEEKVSDKLGNDNDENSLSFRLGNIMEELMMLLLFGFMMK